LFIKFKFKSAKST